MQNLPPPLDPKIEILLTEHLAQIRAFVRLNIDDFLRARESCSDLVQSVCKDVLRASDKLDYRDEPSFRNWLYTAVLNKIRDHKRYYLAQKRSPDREVRIDAGECGRDLAACYVSIATPSQHAAVHERVAYLERAFDRLPEHYRRVITLSRIAGLPHSEIARSLGKSEGAVRILLSRALVQLSAIMEEMGADPV